MGCHEECMECTPNATDATDCIQCLNFNSSGLCVPSCPVGTWASEGSGEKSCLLCHFACAEEVCFGPKQNDCLRFANKNLVFFVILGCCVFLLLLWLLIPVVKWYRRSAMEDSKTQILTQTLKIKGSRSKKAAAINAHQFSDYNPEEDEDHLRNAARNAAFTTDALTFSPGGGGGGGGSGGMNGSVKMRAPKEANTGDRPTPIRPNVEAWAAATLAGDESEDPKAPRLSYVGSITSVSPSESISMKHFDASNQMSIDTTYGDLGSLYDTADESLGDFHHVRASPEMRRKQVAREAQLVKKMKLKEKRQSSASRLSHESESVAAASRRGSERKNLRKGSEQAPDVSRVNSVVSMDSSRVGAASAASAASSRHSGAFEGRRSGMSTTSESEDLDYFADSNQRTVRSLNKMETMPGHIVKAKEVGNRLSIQEIEFNSPNYETPPQPPPHAASSPLHPNSYSYPSLAALSEFAVPPEGATSSAADAEQTNDSRAEQKDNDKSRKKAPILWV